MADGTSTSPPSPSTGGSGGSGLGAALGRAQFVNWNPYELKPRDTVSSALSGGFTGLVGGGITGTLPAFLASPYSSAFFNAG